jgi:hypothetical protein
LPRRASNSRRRICTRARRFNACAIDPGAFGDLADFRHCVGIVTGVFEISQRDVALRAQVQEAQLLRGSALAGQGRSRELDGLRVLASPREIGDFLRPSRQAILADLGVERAEMVWLLSRYPGVRA